MAGTKKVDPRLRADPLLTMVRLMLTVGMAVCILSVVALPIALVAFFVREDVYIAKLAESELDAAALPWIAAIMGLAALIMMLGYFFLRHLRRIVESVSLGDPFVPVNADRLRLMGWLALAIQAIAIPATALVIWFDAAPYKPNVHHGSDGISLGALLLALILFVLARVFRAGAEMREDLEGTV